MNPESLPSEIAQPHEPQVLTIVEFQHRVIAITDKGPYELRGEHFVKMQFKEAET